MVCAGIVIIQSVRLYSAYSDKTGYDGLDDGGRCVEEGILR